MSDLGPHWDLLVDRIADAVVERLRATVVPPVPAPAETPAPAVDLDQPKRGRGPQPQLHQEGPTRVCALCGRSGTRRFHTDDNGRSWVCNDARACAGRRGGSAPRTPAGDVKDRGAETAAPAGPSPAAQPKTVVQPAPAPAPAPAPRPKPAPGVTARCQDCTRTFTLTGRLLRPAIDMHELKHGHIVDVLEATA